MELDLATSRNWNIGTTAWQNELMPHFYCLEATFVHLLKVIIMKMALPIHDMAHCCVCSAQDCIMF